MSKLINPVPLFLDGRGALLDAGSVWIGAAGSDPEIEANQFEVFFDPDLTIPAAQPLRTLGGRIVNGAGPTFVFFAATDHSLKVRDGDGNLVDSILSVNDAAPSYQPLDDDLTAIAEIGTTAYGRGLLAAADAAALRTAAGVGAAAFLGDATAAEFRANTADKALSTDQVWAAAQAVALSQVSGAVAVNLASGFNFTLAMTGGPWTLSAPVNAKPGQGGTIEITQDATGGRVLSFDAAWKFAGGVDPVLSTAANARDVLSYQVLSDGAVLAGLAKAVG